MPDPNLGQANLAIRQYLSRHFLAPTGFGVYAPDLSGRDTRSVPQTVPYFGPRQRRTSRDSQRQLPRKVLKFPRVTQTAIDSPRHAKSRDLFPPALVAAERFPHAGLVSGRPARRRIAPGRDRWDREVKYACRTAD